jgi:hypothetical protein
MFRINNNNNNNNKGYIEIYESIRITTLILFLFCLAMNTLVY